jgi:UDP-glucuronate 4-epimerase
MKILVTGCAGFIGMHVSIKLLERGDQVIGIDNINSYYDVELKNARLQKLKRYENFNFFKVDIENASEINKIFKDESPQKVIHLAAQAGVRYSLVNPSAYINSNIQGFLNILENCRNKKIKHLCYASSSSVYGGNQKLPFSEHDNIDHPVSLYASTKKSNELMAHTYSHLFNIPTTGLRFFTVYGPWGRPDMALFLFTKAIIEGKPINIFNNGNMIRDFTYIDDISEGVVKVNDKPATPSLEFDPLHPDPSTSNAPYRVFNIGNNDPKELMSYIGEIESVLGIKAQKKYMPMQKGDVPVTCSDTSELFKWIGFKPSTSIEYGVKKFIGWYKEFYINEAK